MPKRILTVGFELASNDVAHDTLVSKVSLLDWDIILLKPTIDEFLHSSLDEYMGKPSLNDHSSFALKEACEHWRREINQSIEHGKTVIIFLPPIKEVYVATGSRSISGTGRNQRTTRHVEPYNNYRTIPVDLAPLNAAGTEIKLTSGADVLGPYWAEFDSLSKYEVLLLGRFEGVCLTTKTANKPVGAIIRHDTTPGSLVLLPNIEFSPDKFIETDDEDEEFWTSEAKQFAGRMINAVVALDRALRDSADVSPEPDWATDPLYVLANEETLRSELLEAERQVEVAQQWKEQVQERLREAGKLRALLYEKGKPLERAIVDALKLLGFNAHPFQNGNSEFDVVFESLEGRLLGEAEGKDNKAVNIEKLRQLTMNIQEDLQREDVHAPAKGVLFGNAFRLFPPTARDIQFTQKCIISSQSMNTALVPTSELYRCAQYLADNSDADYSRLCREHLLTTSGVVSLPSPPTLSRFQETALIEDEKASAGSDVESPIDGSPM